MKFFIDRYIILSLFLTCYILTSNEQKYVPPLGTLIPVNGYKLHMIDMGQAHQNTPTIILDACLGGNCLEWSLVQPTVATFAHICSYDRAGLGWSEPSSEQRISSSIIEELRVLLCNAGIKPPYILVGHSSGGINMQLFAHRYPQEVYGLILVDSSHEEQQGKIQALQDQFLLSAKSAVNTAQNVSWLPEELHEAYIQLQTNPLAKLTATREREVFGISLQEVAHSINQLTDKPLCVITRGTKVIDQATEERLSYEKALHNLWSQFQQDFLLRSTKSKQIIAHGSGHMIQRDRPDIIIEAIREMVIQYQNEHKINETIIAWNGFLKENSWQSLTQDLDPVHGGCGSVYMLSNFLQRPNESFAIADMSNIAYSEPHYHSQGVTEIYFMLEGSGKVVVGYDEHECKVGDVIVTPPVTTHYVIPDNPCVLGVVNIPAFDSKDYHMILNTNHFVKFDQQQFLKLIQSIEKAK